jgi:hypothetical protein
VSTQKSDMGKMPKKDPRLSEKPLTRKITAEPFSHLFITLVPICSVLGRNALGHNLNYRVISNVNTVMISNLFHLHESVQDLSCTLVAFSLEFVSLYHEYNVPNCALILFSVSPDRAGNSIKCEDEDGSRFE